MARHNLKYPELRLNAFRNVEIQRSVFSWALNRTANESLILGTAIWIYCILANNASAGVTIFTNASFELDGAIVGGYEHNPDPSQGPFLYNVSVFRKTDLSNAEHTLVMTAMQEPEPSSLLFDYAVYT